MVAFVSQQRRKHGLAGPLADGPLYRLQIFRPWRFGGWIYIQYLTQLLYNIVCRHDGIVRIVLFLVTSDHFMIPFLVAQSGWVCIGREDKDLQHRIATPLHQYVSSALD